MKHRGIAITLVIMLVFCQFAIVSQTSVKSWSEFSNFYRYSYYKETSIYDSLGNVIDTAIIDVDYFFYNLTTINDTLFFRSSESSKILAFLKCQDFICYNMCLYEKFDYEPVTDTVAFGYEYNQNENQLFIVNARSDHYANYFDYKIPFDILQVFLTNYLWFGLFGIFLPMTSVNFTLKMDYSTIEDGSFTVFDFLYDTEFKYRRNRYSGHNFKISFEGGQYFDYQAVFENHQIEYKYSEKGELYSFQDKGKLYSNFSDEVVLLKEITWNMFLEEEGSEVFKTRISLNSLFSSLLLIVLIRINKKVRVYSSD